MTGKTTNFGSTPEAVELPHNKYIHVQQRTNTWENLHSDRMIDQNPYDIMIYGINTYMYMN